MSASAVELDIAGPAAPPRLNGELVFAEPWESRVFGMAMSLADQKLFSWDEFRDALIARIQAWEAAPPEGECWSYYQCWANALQDVVIAKQVLSADVIGSRISELADRPAGYDHGHDHSGDNHHDHDHDHGGH